MFSRKIVGKILIPAAVLVSEKGKEMKCCKPSELPIYTSEPPPEPKRIMRDPPTKVEQEIGNVRRQIVSLSSQLTAIQDYAVDAVEEAWCECEGVIEYLQQEDNTTPRYGAIAVGGLAGFILGLRGGKFRKLLFTTIGALGMAAVCYPTEAAEYSEQIKEEAIQYFRIAYNFYHGVKKDDPPLELPSLPSLPSIPKNFSEFMNLFSSSSNKNSDSSVIGDKKESSVCGDDLEPLSLDLDTDEKVPEIIDSEEVVNELHERAIHDDCHCPIGTCLNPMDEDPNCDE